MNEKGLLNGPFRDIGEQLSGVFDNDLAGPTDESISSNSGRSYEVSSSESGSGEKECLICRGLISEIPKFAEIVSDRLKKYEYDTFQIGVRVDPEINIMEEKAWSDIGAKFQEPIKAELNREIGKMVYFLTKKRVDIKNPDIVAIINTAFDHVDVQISPLFLYGRYKKLRRGIPQTKWFCRRCRGRGCDRCNDTGKQYEESVEEIIGAKVLEHSKGEATKFHGMGREDIDAKMIGSGRPFVLEISNPVKRVFEISSLEDEINEFAQGKVVVSDFSYADRSRVREVKLARFPKYYRIRVNFERSVAEDDLNRAIDELDNSIIEQRTPARVSHRRADKVRKRKVYSMSLHDYDNENGIWAVFDIKGESGLYVKELIHSDNGRTKPSIKEIVEGQVPLAVTIESLDVLGVMDNDVPETLDSN